MNNALRLVALLLMALPCAAEEPVEIPLDQIWAYNMPGTRPISQMIVGEQPLHETAEGAILAEIVRSLKYNTQNRPVARKGFAVSGEGLEALREAHAVLAQGKEKRTSFRKNEKICLVFFSNQYGDYVHLVGAEQRGDVIQLLYLFVPHLTHELTTHIALIPVSTARAGPIQVEIKPQIISTKIAGELKLWIRRIVCGSFVFDVLEE